MRVLVTGATGFLGRHIVEAFRTRGHTVRAVHRPETQPGFPSDVELATFDLRAPRGLDTALIGVDLVVHAAAVKVGDLHDQFAGTVVTTQHLVTAMRRAELGRLVLVSSFSVYDPEQLPMNGILDERAPVGDAADARDAYSATKLLQEEVVEQAARGSDWSLTIVRPGAIYGPDNLWFTRLGYRTANTWVGIGSRARVPASYVGNAADAIAHLAERTEPGVRWVNVVDDDPPTQHGYRRELAARSQGPRYHVVVPWPLAHLTIWILDRTNRLLGSPLRLPGALRLDAAVARWKPLTYPNDLLHQLGWRQPVAWPSTLDASLEPPGDETAAAALDDDLGTRPRKAS